MKNEWWKQTAQHMWRTYFRLMHKPGTLSAAEQTTCTICDAAFHSLPDTDRDIVRAFYSSRHQDGQITVTSYSQTHDIPSDTIWIVITRANRILIEHTGLLDRKNPRQNGTGK